MKDFKKFLLIPFLCGFMCLGFSCSDSDETPEWIWDKETEEPEPEVESKPRYIWIDAAANFPDYANSKENIVRDLTLAKKTGFTDIVVDVRPTMGDVLFSTQVEKQVEKLDYWSDAGYAFYERTATWDYLQAFIDAARDLELRVHASINTFVGGNAYMYGLEDQGMLFRDEAKKDWATTVHIASGLTNVMDVNEEATNYSYSTKFLNPVNEEVQNYILSLLRDLAAYDLDGIFLDRCRFDALTSDFSEYTRQKYEEYAGEKVANFPADIMEANMSEWNAIPSTTPVHFKKWLEFRVKVIHDFIVKARETVKGVNGKIQFGVYVGAWYSNYYGVGVNWASPKYNTAADFPKWATEDYKNFGYADHLDFMLLGAYAAPDKVYGSGEWTIEGFCKSAANKLLGDVKYAGGPDVGNWTIPDGWGPNELKPAVASTVDAAINNGDGYFLFDIIHLKKNGYWTSVKEGIDKYFSEIPSE